MAMKCQYCGANLSLEDEVCPYCGRPNEQAKMHVRDMKDYRGRYQQAEQEVYRSARRSGRIAGKAVVLVILIVVNVVVGALGLNTYSLRRSLRERDAERNAETYTAEMNQLLEQEDYLRFSEFCEYYEVDVYDKGAYEVYGPLRMAARTFSESYSSLAEAVMPGGYTSEHLCEYVAEDLERFWRNTDPERIREYSGCDVDMVEKAFAGMRFQMKQLLMTYLECSEAEAEAMISQSKARNTIFIEERLYPGGLPGSETAAEAETPASGGAAETETDAAETDVAETDAAETDAAETETAGGTISSERRGENHG